MRAAVLANGRLLTTPRLRRWLRSADLLICADGGLRTARRLRLRPDVAIGDFDSAPPALRRWAITRGAVLVSHPQEKDKTDTELALEYARERGAREVDLYGVLGRRLDHLLANVALLVRAEARGVRARILDGRTAAFLARRRTPLQARRGDLVSLLPLTPVVTGISTRGLRYPLQRAALRQGSSLGVSNVVVAPPAVVSVRSGRLLVVITYT